jgi:hypothetical protein
LCLSLRSDVINFYPSLRSVVTLSPTLRSLSLVQLQLQITFQSTAEALAFVADLQRKRNFFDRLEEVYRRAAFKPQSFEFSKKSKSIIQTKVKAWGKYLAGSLTVTTLENGDLLQLCAVHDAQRELRKELVAQEGAHGRQVSFTFPVHLIPSKNSKSRRRDAVFYAFDPLNGPCGNRTKKTSKHFSTAAHQAWLDGQDDEEEDDVFCRVEPSLPQERNNSFLKKFLRAFWRSRHPPFRMCFFLKCCSPVMDLDPFWLETA